METRIVHLENNTSTHAYVHIWKLLFSLQWHLVLSAVTNAPLHRRLVKHSNRITFACALYLNWAWVCWGQPAMLKICINCSQVKAYFSCTYSKHIFHQCWSIAIFVLKSESDRTGKPVLICQLWLLLSSRNAHPHHSLNESTQAIAVS